jgi:hypothetical protein
MRRDGDRDIWGVVTNEIMLDEMMLHEVMFDELLPFLQVGRSYFISPLEENKR